MEVEENPPSAAAAAVAGDDEQQQQDTTTATTTNPLLLAEEQQLHGIKEPHNNDVLCGRGVTTNRFPGNCSFRALVGVNKVRLDCGPKFFPDFVFANCVGDLQNSEFPLC